MGVAIFALFFFPLAARFFGAVKALAATVALSIVVFQWNLTEKRVKID